MADAPTSGSTRTEDQPSLRLDDPAHLYEHAPCGYLSTDPQGVIVKVNRTFLSLTGYADADLVGRRTFADLLSAGGRIYHETHYAPLLHAVGSAREIALDVVRADGDRVPVLVNAVLHRDDAGEPVRIDAAVFDATDRREYERELLRAKDRAERSEARASALARTLQQTLIPPTPPAIPGLDVAAVYRAAGDGAEVGGDFYDVFEIAADDWVVTLGDVRGKGVEAAVVTALARFTLRGACVREPNPSDALRALNEVLLHHETDRFLTAVLLRLRRAGDHWSVTASCGGHPPPRLVSRDRHLRSVECAGTVLGVLEDPELHDTTIDLAPGDRLVSFTDGVTEGRRGEAFYGVRRLHQNLRDTAEGDAATTATALLSDVLDFQDDEPRDDIAVVVVRCPDVVGPPDADDPPPPSEATHAR